MNKDDLTLLGCFGLFAWFVIATPLFAILNGWVLSVMWGWFVVPLFNLPPLTIPYAIGMSFVISMFKSKKYKIDEEDKDKGNTYLILRATLIDISTPLAALFSGWLVTLFL